MRGDPWADSRLWSGGPTLGGAIFMVLLTAVWAGLMGLLVAGAIRDRKDDFTCVQEVTVTSTGQEVSCFKRRK